MPDTTEHDSDTKIKLELEIQNPSNQTNIPTINDFQHWLSLLINDQKEQIKNLTPTSQDMPISIVLRIVDEAESQSLNQSYRDKNSPTNVLSFPFETPDLSILAEPDTSCDENSNGQGDFLSTQHLGDLVLCASIIKKEAQQQDKTLTQHWAHMSIHGTLHLLGYDHIDEQQATIMEALEINLLHNLGFANPYEKN